MPRQAKLRKKNGYWMTKAGGTEMYFGKVAGLPYTDARRLFLDHLKAAAERTRQRRAAVTVEVLCDLHLDWLKDNRTSRSARAGTAPWSATWPPCRSPRTNSWPGKAGRRVFDSATRITRKWRAWPGQHLLCGVCGNLFYWGGHGQAAHMMCAGAREYKCWNAVTFDGIEAPQKLCAAMLTEIEALNGFGPTFLRKVREKATVQLSASDSQCSTIALELAKVRRKIERVKCMILDELARPKSMIFSAQLAGRMCLGDRIGLAIAVGPVGRELEKSTEIPRKADVFCYSHSRGLFAGLTRPRPPP